MGRKPKIIAEEKAIICEQYLSEKKRMIELTNDVCVHKNTIHSWVSNYKTLSTDAFIAKPHNVNYTKEFKATSCGRLFSQLRVLEKRICQI